jgi:hypothetical protein
MVKNSNFGEEFKVMLQILIKLLEINQTKNDLKFFEKYLK